MGNVLLVSDRIIQLNAQAAERKGDKLASRWLGSYTIMEVRKNGNYTMADANGKVRATKMYTSQMKRYTERVEDYVWNMFDILYML